MFIDILDAIDGKKLQVSVCLSLEAKHFLFGAVFMAAAVCISITIKMF